jgi:dienelactone hydrolase
MRLLIPALAFLLAVSLVLRADGPADNRSDQVRRIPPPGLAIPDDARRELTDGAAKLGADIEALRGELAGKPALLALLPDVQIFHKSVDWALRYDEFFRTNEVESARNQLQEGRARIAALREGRAPWTTATGLVVRGYVSRIDGSVQPYGLVVPDTYSSNSPQSFRLDFWFHGRGEQLSELSFLNDRMRNRGEFTPPNAFVLHLYGRYCNGSRFAGEMDFWEAFADVKRHYPIDEDRLVVRGFSLGGASCWHFATHYASRWAAAAPGAGFSETAEFLNVFQNETLTPAPWEQKLWRLYDSTADALNLSMVPLVAYSGADDRQKQAADAMAKAMGSYGLELTHLIGPKTGHSYEKGAKAELNRIIDALAARGRDPLPKTVRFITHSLRHNQMAWVTVDALGQHWEPARVEAQLRLDDNEIGITTTNVEALTLTIPPGLSPFDPTQPVNVEINGEKVTTATPQSDRSWKASLVHRGPAWRFENLPAEGLRKRHGLQGPIDDAFLDSFVFVRPTGQPLNAAVGAWVTNEMAHAVEHWRRQFRGDAPIKDDRAISDADLASQNLVLWGDPQSNAVLGRIAEKLGVRWDATGVHTPAANYPADKFVAVEIFPNPLNPQRYVVVNSGFTFREYDYLNNARQTPKLPDWAVIDITKPMTSRAPGGLAAAGFFGEQWEWPP